MSICGSKVEDRERPPRAAEDGWDGREAFAWLLVSVGLAAALARSPPPVKPDVKCLPPAGMRVEDRCRPPGEGRDMGEEDDEDAAGIEVLIGGVEEKGVARVVVTGDSEETVVAGVAVVGEEPP